MMTREMATGWCRSLSWDNRVQNRLRGDTEAEIGCYLLIMKNKWLMNTPVGNSIHIFHHRAKTVQNSEIVTKELLGPTTNESLKARIIKNGSEGATIPQPIKMNCPKIFVVSTDSKATGGTFTCHGMITRFSGGTRM